MRHIQTLCHACEQKLLKSERLSAKLKNKPPRQPPASSSTGCSPVLPLLLPVSSSFSQVTCSSLFCRNACRRLGPCPPRASHCLSDHKLKWILHHAVAFACGKSQSEHGSPPVDQVFLNTSWRASDHPCAALPCGQYLAGSSRSLPYATRSLHCPHPQLAHRREQMRGRRCPQTPKSPSPDEVQTPFRPCLARPCLPAFLKAPRRCHQCPPPSPYCPTSMC